MKKEPFRIYCATCLLLIHENQLLLMKRKNTGFGDGWWSVPGGSIEGGETMKAALIRETKEELGIEIHPDDLTFTTCVHSAPHFRTPREVLLFCFHASHYSGAIENKEPEKCEEIRFFPLDALPEHFLEGGKLAISHLKNGIHFGEIHF